MLVEDRAAFVERLEVPAEGSEKRRSRMKRAELETLNARWEAHLAASAVLELERRVDDEPSERRLRALRRELSTIRKHLESKQEELARSTARLERLQARSDEGARRPYVAFRLHSAGHHVDCSESRFGRLAARQLQRAVHVLRDDGRTWWWFLNRCWWDDARLRAGDVETFVLRRDLQRMLESDELARARIAILGETEGDEKLPVPDSLHLDVWSRHRGRCVDCSSDERVNFDKIIASARASEAPRNFELRCQACRDRREHNEGRARISRAWADAVVFERIY